VIGRQGPTFDEQAPQPVAVVSGVASQAAAGRDSADQGQCDANVAKLAGGYFERNGASARIGPQLFPGLSTNVRHPEHRSAARQITSSRALRVLNSSGSKTRFCRRP
jgi:hypothetical protein